MTRKDLHNDWKNLAAQLMFAAASFGSLTALAGCDQSDRAQLATTVISGNVTLGAPDSATVDPFKDISSGRLASNHNETFLLA